MARVGATTVVCLNEVSELRDRYPDYVDWLRKNARHHPIPDFHAPNLDELDVFVEELHDLLVAGETLLVHCGGGIGRAGTIAVALLLRRGASLDDAIVTVRTHRPMAGPEVGTQRDVLEAYELVCRSRTIQDR